VSAVASAVLPMLMSRHCSDLPRVCCADCHTIKK